VSEREERFENLREMEVISVTEVNFSGTD